MIWLTEQRSMRRIEPFLCCFPHIPLHQHPGRVVILRCVAYYSLSVSLVAFSSVLLFGPNRLQMTPALKKLAA